MVRVHKLIQRTRVRRAKRGIGRCIESRLCKGRHPVNARSCSMRRRLKISLVIISQPDPTPIMSTSISPSSFTLSIPDDAIAHLRTKLSTVRFPDELSDVNWEYGVPLCDIQRLVTYWKDGYDWRRHEREINDSLPQFTADIYVDGFETLNVHFVHKRSGVDGAIPLLFVHGCAY